MYDECDGDDDDDDDDEAGASQHTAESLHTRSLRNRVSSLRLCASLFVYIYIYIYQKVERRGCTTFCWSFLRLRSFTALISFSACGLRGDVELLNPSFFCQVTNNSFPPSSWRVPETVHCRLRANFCQVWVSEAFHNKTGFCLRFSCVLIHFPSVNPTHRHGSLFGFLALWQTEITSLLIH